MSVRQPLRQEAKREAQQHIISQMEDLKSSESTAIMDDDEGRRELEAEEDRRTSVVNGWNPDESCMFETVAQYDQALSLFHWGLDSDEQEKAVEIRAKIAKRSALLAAAYDDRPWRPSYDLDDFML